ncbi:MAG: DUF47 domain-containing protein [Promethearchaeota archaeon]
MEGRLSNKVLQIALDHARKVKECASTLAQVIEHWVKGEREEAQKKYELLITIEKEADKIKNSLTLEVAEVDMLGLVGKEMSFTGIILKTDQLIDYAEGTAQRLIYCSWTDIPADVMDKAIKLSEVIMDALFKVRDVFYSLQNNPDRILKYCKDIDDLERESDKMFRELQKILFSDALKSVDLRIILPFLDAMEHLEDMGDIAESVADSMKIFYIGKFGSK